MIKLGDTEEVFRVSYTEGSDFREMWKGYPIKGGQGSSPSIADELLEDKESAPENHNRRERRNTPIPAVIATRCC